MKDHELRWIEIQFYFVLIDLWNLHYDFKDVLEFTKCAKIFGDFDQSRICSLAQNALMYGRLRMNSDEYLILSWVNKVPFNAITKYKKIHKLQLGRLIKQFNENPDEFYYYPKSPKEDILEMKKFLKAVDAMKEVGITWITKSTRSSGRYSNRLELLP